MLGNTVLPHKQDSDEVLFMPSPEKFRETLDEFKVSQEIIGEMYVATTEDGSVCA